MTGTIINALAIIFAGLIGLLLGKGIPQNISRTVEEGLGLLVLVIGIQYALKAESLVIIGISLAVGAMIGELRQWEAKLDKLAYLLQVKLGSGEDDQFVKGFVSACVLFCVGAMAVMGSLEDGLTGNYEILLIKSILDGIFSLIFAASMGIGVLFSAIPVLIYQGAISLGATFIKPILTDPILNNINAFGGVLIAGLGLNIIGITKIRVVNLLPGIIVVPIIMALYALVF
ncbi:MAG TPA: DUF554 domain-containing protein [Syntrophomonadaceae bacterium]|nr:DUF554 domain-containing protein [Syntrophomonadaceae bacterium]